MHRTLPAKSNKKRTKYVPSNDSYQAAMQAIQSIKAAQDYKPRKPNKPSAPYIDDIHDKDKWSLWMPYFSQTTVAGVDKRRLVTPVATFRRGMKLSEALARVETFGTPTLGETMTTARRSSVKMVAH